ncbi:conserved hypothetical protein [Trichinella spiralis]|uniref:hypothetical protein n=1 Tax=Trichinella spiralis TaxID=6334 RepID=UPI0001EFE423|nr:conserved hypothetical protein [Trichinella spiralis]
MTSSFKIAYYKCDSYINLFVSSRDDLLRQQQHSFKLAIECNYTDKNLYPSKLKQSYHSTVAIVLRYESQNSLKFINIDGYYYNSWFYLREAGLTIFAMEFLPSKSVGWLICQSECNSNR